MKRWILRLLLGLMAIAFVLVAAIVIFTFTPTFNRIAGDRILQAANESIRGEIHVGRIEGAIWTGLTLHDVDIELDDSTVLSAEKLAVDYSLLSLLGGGLEVTGIDLVGPILQLSQDDGGNWNIAEVFAAVQPQPQPEPTPAAEGSGPPLRIDAPSIAIRDGRVVVKLAGEPSRVYRADSLSATGQASFEGADIDAAVNRLSAWVTTEGAPPVRVEVEDGSYLADAGGWRAAADSIVAQTEASRIAVDGRVAGAESPRINGNIEIGVSAEELRQFLPSMPLRADVSGEAHVDGPPSALDVSLSLKAAEATLGLDGRADLSATPLTYAGQLKLADAAIDQLLTIEEVGGTVNAELQVSGNGTELGGAVVEGSTTVESLRIGAEQLGDARTRLVLRDGRLHTEGALSGQGEIDWNAKVALEAETYDAVIETRQLDLGGIAPEEARLDGEINLTARVEGRGFEPARMDTNVSIDLRPSQLGPVKVTGGTIAGRIVENRVQVADLVVRAADAELSATGGLGLAAGAEAQLQYDLDVPDLEPWLALTNQAGKGSLTLRGSAGGTLEALSAQGRLRLTDVRVGGTRLTRGTAEFDLAGIGGDSPWPHGRVQASLAGVDVGQPIETLEAGVELEETDPPQARVEVVAVMWEDRTQRLRAEVTLAPEQTVADLREIVLNVPVGTWRLMQPARVVYGGDRIAVDNLQLANGTQSLTADGAIAAEGGSQLTVRARDFQLGVIEPFLGAAARDIRGKVDAEVVVGGTPAEPDPSGTIALRGGGAHLAELNVTVKDAVLDAEVTPDRIAITKLSARADEGRLRGSGAIALDAQRLHSLTVDLTATEWPAIRTQRYEAVVAADLHAEGTLEAPRVSGRVEVLEAEIRPDFALLQENEPPPRDPTIVIVGRQDPEVAATEENDGLEATAALMENLALDLTLEVERNTWIKRDDSALEVVGTLEFDKAPGETTPSITGSVRVERGWIYLYGRRFEPERGIVTFTGGSEINPSLDIVLRSRVDEYEVRTIIAGTADKPTLAFESTPQLEEADILAVLLFGKPVGQLGQGEQVALEEQAANIAAGYVAGRIGRAVGEAFGFQVSEVDVEERRLGVGRYLTPKTYVSVNQEFAGEAGREVRIEYYLTPSWTLSTEVDSEGESGADVFWKYEY